MNKTEFIAAVAEKAEISKKDSEKALKAFVDVVAEQLKAGYKVQLVGFGTFEVSERAAREGRNPQTGETMTINEIPICPFLTKVEKMPASGNMTINCLSNEITSDSIPPSNA